MNKLIISLSLTTLLFIAYGENDTSPDYLKQVLEKLESIESANFWIKGESWAPGDTAANIEVNQYVESYRNASDTTLGVSWATFKTNEKKCLTSAYDGNMRVLIYDDVKGMVVDSFKVRKLPFRPMTPPFFNYTENIIKYILTNNDSTTLIQKDLGKEIYLKLTIHEDRQVEFFDKAHYIPKNPYIFDPTSIYELWINKESNLPWKVRREMSHNISVTTVYDFEFNKQSIDNFVASDYFPKDYEVRQYGQRSKKRKPNNLIGKKAPEWTLQSDVEQNISLADLKSKVVMMQFTSVSCGPCKASIPFLKELSNEYTKEDFDFVAIECTSNNINALKTYKHRSDFDYKFLQSTKEVLEKYSINSFPVFMIVDENREIKKVISGYGKGKTDKEIRTFINQLI